MNTSWTKKATVFIPNYNHSHFLPFAIDSVLQQRQVDLDQIEILVVDDGSTDDISGALAPYSDRVRLIRLPHSGKARATTTGIQEARGEYFFNLDADDVFFENKLITAIEILDRHPQVTRFAHPMILWDARDGSRESEVINAQTLDQAISGDQVLRESYLRNSFQGGGSSFVTRTAIIRDIRIDDEISAYVDQYLVLRCLQRGASYFHSEPLSLYRLNHGTNYTMPTDLAPRIEEKIRAITATWNAVLRDEFPEAIVNFLSLRFSRAICTNHMQLGTLRLEHIRQMASAYSKALNSAGSRALELTWHHRMPQFFLKLLFYPLSR